MMKKPTKKNSVLAIFDDPIGDELRAAIQMIKEVESREGRLSDAGKKCLGIAGEKIQKVLGVRAELDRRIRDEHMAGNELRHCRRSRPRQRKQPHQDRE